MSVTLLRNKFTIQACQFFRKKRLSILASCMANQSKFHIVFSSSRLFLLNNKIFTFHDLFTFTESSDKQQPLFNLLQYIIIYA